jgi:hypothetical protein
MARPGGQHNPARRKGWSRRGQAPHDEAAVGQIADADRRVEPLRDQVNEAVGVEELQLNLRVGCDELR